MNASGSSEADLVGLLDVREVRDRIIDQRDLVADKALPALPAPREAGGTDELLREIRDVLVRIEEGRKG